MMIWKTFQKYAAETAITIVFFVFLLPVCGAIFHCGCLALWNGADTHCNYKKASAMLHCPLCEGLVQRGGSNTLRLFAQGVIVSIMLFPTFLMTSFLRRRYSLNLFFLTLAGLAALVPSVLLVTFILAKTAGYPHYL